MQKDNLIKAYKGFDKDLKCRGYKYEIGKEYEHKGEVKLCKSGFHFCESPLDIFNYYPPIDEKGNINRYCEIEASGEIKKEKDGLDTKVASNKIKINTELNFLALAQAHIEYVKKNNINEKTKSNTGSRSVATNTGDWSATTNTGNRSVAANTGNRSVATNTGNRSATIISGKESIAAALGIKSKAKGSKGCWLVLAEWEQDKEYNWHIKNVVSVKVDDKTIKANVFYTLKNGSVIKAEGQNE